jgi:chromosomal replication initiator protein
VSAFPLIAVAERSCPAFPMRRVTIAEIQQKVADRCGVTVEQMISYRRVLEVARPRQLAMLLAWHLTAHSLSVIGRHFGGRDHSTVVNAVWNAKRRNSQDPEADHLFRQLKSELER